MKGIKMKRAFCENQIRIPFWHSWEIYEYGGHFRKIFSSFLMYYKFYKLSLSPAKKKKEKNSDERFRKFCL